LIGPDDGTEEDYAALPDAEAKKIKTRLLDVQKAFDSAKDASKKAYSNHAANKLVRGTTAISQYSYDLKTELMERATQGEKVIDELLTSLVNLKHIEKDEPDDAASEYKMIDEILLGMQQKNIAMYLIEGAPAKYPVTGDKEASTALMTGKQKSADNAVKEMESYITRMLSRNEDYAGQVTSLKRELAWALAQKDKIKGDDYAPYAEKVRAEYEEWLRARIEEIQNKIDSDDDDGDEDGKSDEEKELEKEIEYGERFDDPKAVKEAQAMLDKIKKDKGSSSTRSINTDKSSGEGKEPAKPSGYDDGFPDPRDTSGGNKNLKNSISTEYNGKNGSGRNGGDNGNGSGNSDTGGGTGTGSGNNAGNANGNGSGGNGSGSGNGNGSGHSRQNAADKNGSGSGNKNNKSAQNNNNNGKNNKNDADKGKGMTEDELNNLLKGLLGTDFSNLPPDAKGAVVAALNQYGREHNNEPLLVLARKLLTDMMDEHSEYVYAKYRNDPNAEYVSFAAIDRARTLTRFRYVHVDLDATMSYLGSGTSYEYKVGQSSYSMSNGDTGLLNAPLVEQADPYIHNSQTMHYAYLDEGDAKQMLDVRAEYIIQTEYAVLVAGKMEPTIQSVIAALDKFFAGTTNE
ncbi:MAG: hypothetical protein IJT32_03325, partial [Lachnospiraceae bacterium]|nr:hypothetical protein [Lachnospiraceae bacterium]